VAKKVNSVVIYVLETETTMNVITTPRGLERVPKKKETKIAKQFCYGNSPNLFPLEYGVVEMNVSYTVPNLLPSEVTGASASFVREYELVCKCDLFKLHGDVKMSIPISINNK